MRAPSVSTFNQPRYVKGHLTKYGTGTYDPRPHGVVRNARDLYLRLQGFIPDYRRWRLEEVEREKERKAFLALWKRDGSSFS